MYRTPFVVSETRAPFGDPRNDPRTPGVVISAVTEWPVPVVESDSTVIVDTVFANKATIVMVRVPSPLERVASAVVKSAEPVAIVSASRAVSMFDISVLFVALQVIFPVTSVFPSSSVTLSLNVPPVQFASVRVQIGSVPDTGAPAF